MRFSLTTWLTSCFLGVWCIQVCLAALPVNGAQEFDEFAAQEQQPVTPNAAKVLPHANRLVNRAIRGPQANAAVPRLSAQLKSQTAQPKITSSTQPPQEQNDQEEETNNAPKPEGTVEEEQPKEEISSTTTSSTEVTKKTYSRIRPFQSNQAFLERLRRRQELQRQHGYTVLPPTSPSTSTELVEKASTKSTSRKSSTVHPKGGFSPEQANTGSQKKSTNRRYNSNKLHTVSSTTPLAQVNEAVVEESNPAPQTARSRTYPKHNRKIRFQDRENT